MNAPEARLIDEAGEMHVESEAIDLKHYKLEDWLSVGLFWLLGLIVFYQFFTRYALNDSAAWTEEIARYFLVVTVFVGAAVSVRKNNHIQVDFFYRVLPRKPMRVMSTLVDGVRIAFFGACIVMTWRALGVAWANWRRGASVLEQPALMPRSCTCWRAAARRPSWWCTAWWAASTASRCWPCPSSSWPAT